MSLKGSKKPFCLRGHPRTPENLYGRRCRLCESERLKAKTAARRVMSGRFPPGEKPACYKGHLFTTENTYIYPRTGDRMCRTCLRANAERWATANPQKVRAARLRWDAKMRERRKGRVP